MTVYPLQANFSRGELTPKLHARVDLEYYRAALKTCTNWTVMKQGGLRKRPGFKYIRETRDSSKTSRLIPFIFSTEQAYVLEFGENYVRKFANRAAVSTLVGTPTAVTKANPGVITLASHGLSTGNKALLLDIGGMVELRNREVTVTVVDPNTFSIGIDTSSYTTFTSGGTVRKIVETTTEYVADDVSTLDYAQTADVLSLTHANHAPAELTRTSDTAWSISNIVFKDGPYFDYVVGNDNGCTPDITNAIHPAMTDNTTPSGTVANSESDTDAYYAFDRVNSTSSGITTAVGWWTYTPASSVVCNSYWIKAHADQVAKAPVTWTFQGYDGSDWIVLDTKTNEGSWGRGEVRYYDFQNTVAYDAYKIDITGSNGDDSLRVVEFGWGYNGDYAPTMTLTFDTTDNINDDAGFDSDDVGRPIRLYGGGGQWRWFLIEGVTSTKIVTGRMYGYALPDLSKIFKWQLGAWRADHWPELVSFYEARRAFARSAKEPHVEWFSKTFDFYDMGTSQPLVDDDGIRLRIQSGQVNGITFISELTEQAVGTTDGVRVLGKANANAGFGATNFDMKPNTFRKSKRVRPVRVGEALIFVGYHGKTLHELVYSLQSDGYIAPDLSVLSEHLIAGVVKEMAYQEAPDTIVWLVMEDGSFVAMTYEREQKVVAFTRIEIAGGDTGTSALVESVACIPGSGRDEVYVIVKRTIGGVTKRYVELLTDEFETGMATEDGIFLDSALSYSGSATTTVYGAAHLAGQTVNALADGIVERDLTVSATGAVTLAAAASKIHIGKKYTATGVTLSLEERGQKDGAATGRRALLQDVKASVMDTVDLRVSGLTSDRSYPVIKRENSDPAGGQIAQRTGVFPVKFDSSYRDDGQFMFFSEEPLPCTLRGFAFGVNGEP